MNLMSEIVSTGNSQCQCPIAGIMDIIAKKWSLCVVNAIANHEKIRFKELQDELGNITPKTLTESLKKLLSANLIKRESHNEIPPRVEYSLTNEGDSLRQAIVPLFLWALERTDPQNATCCGDGPGNIC